MAKLEKHPLRLRDGRLVTVGHAEPGLARTTRDLTARTLARSLYLIRTAEEYDVSVRQQRAWLKTMEASSNEICLVALDRGRAIAMLDSMVEPRLRLRHVTSFGVVVDPEWQGAGLGRALVTRFIAWARAHPELEKIELHRHAPNYAAEMLYTSLGFVEEGRRKRAIRYNERQYVDDVLMGLMLDKTHNDKGASS